MLRAWGLLTMLIAALVLGTGASTATAQQPRGLTAPAYPGNTLTLERDEPIVAGTVVRVGISGHAQWDGPTDELTTGYDLYLYVQDADIDSGCEPWYGEQLQKGINLGINATSSTSGWVMRGDLEIQPDPPAAGIDWAIESLPFAVRPGVERVVLCAYQRYVIDDVASFQLPVRVEQPRCRPARRTVRRGRALKLRCNLSGRVTVRFRGNRSRTVRARLRSSDGEGAVSTRRLRPGRYRVMVRSGEYRLGRPFTVRVRR